MQSPLNGHRAHLQCTGGAAITPAPQHHPPHHLRQWGLQLGQGRQCRFGVGRVRKLLFRGLQPLFQRRRQGHHLADLLGTIQLLPLLRAETHGGTDLR